MKLIVCISLLLTSMFAVAAEPTLKIAISEQIIGQKFDSSNPSEKRSFIGLNLSERYFSSRCIEPEFKIDPKTNTLRYEREWSTTGSSWYGPINVHFFVSVQKDTDKYYTVRTRITNNGTLVTATSFVNLDKPFLETDYGTTFDADLYGENVDKISLTPVLTMATCQ